MGVNGGYTQADVTQVARVLTGWTVDRPQLGGEFQFNANRHEPGTKKVMGAKIKENGETEGRELLHMLAMRPATARVHLAQAGDPVCERRSAAGAGGADGEVVSRERRRYSGGAEDAVPLAGVLGGGRR